MLCQFVVLAALFLSGWYANYQTSAKVTDHSFHPTFSEEPLRVGIAGLVHTHVHWILGREDRGDIEIVGIAEANTELASRYSKMHGYPMDIVFGSLDAMVDSVKPEAVFAFNTIHDHLEVVEYCAPRGIHVMVEKPLAVNMKHANRMADLARKYDIFLLTNYETTWYDTHNEAYRRIHTDNAIGELRRMIFYTGHPGPIEIGCNEEFLEWLTDPVLNGGGALTDFGCYGANLATWFLDGRKPVRVTCVTRQIKPHLYPKVDDDATIILDYENTEAVIMASWNWSHNRKETEIYGTSGYIFCRNGSSMEVMTNEEQGASDVRPAALPVERSDPFAYLAQLIRNDEDEQPFSPSSLENNLIVMEILQAAKRSAETGQSVSLMKRE